MAAFTVCLHRRANKAIKMGCSFFSSGQRIGTLQTYNTISILGIGVGENGYGTRNGQVTETKASTTTTVAGMKCVLVGTPSKVHAN